MMYLEGVIMKRIHFCDILFSFPDVPKLEREGQEGRVANGGNV
jgi:hypothetical protein